MRTTDLPVLGSDRTLLDGLRLMDGTGLEIVLVVCDRKLVGILTDGDARRGLIRGLGLGCRITEVMQTHYRWVTPAVGRAEVLDMMKALRFKHVPVLDPDGAVVGLHLLNDIIASNVRPNPALILCGGLGTRLRPITETVPKPMIRVAGRPILERIVLHLVGQGIRSIHLAIHYLGEQIQAHFGDGSSYGCDIQYIVEEQPLGTGGAFGLLPESVDQPVLVMNGDLVTQFDVGRLIDAHAAQGNRATVGVRSYSHQVPFGVVDARDQIVLGIREKPILASTINTGIYMLDPVVREFVRRNEPTTVPTILDACIRSGWKVGLFHIDDDWIDVGRHEELDRARGTAGGTGAPGSASPAPARRLG